MGAAAALEMEGSGAEYDGSARKTDNFDNEDDDNDDDKTSLL